MFFITVPSWVIPGTYAENLKFLKEKKDIRGVELLFFIYNEETEKQLDSEWKQIGNYGERFVFTAHLPELLLPAHDALIARLAPLVRHFVFHPSAENPAAQAALLGEWTKRFGAVFLAENTFSGINPKLDDVSPLYNLIPDAASLCMDTGHLLLEGKSPAEFFGKFGEHIGEIHLHSVDRKQAAIDGKLHDHRQLREDEPWLLELIPMLKDYRGIINLEVFSWNEAHNGIEVLKKLCDKLNIK